MNRHRPVDHILQLIGSHACIEGVLTALIQCMHDTFWIDAPHQFQDVDFLTDFLGPYMTLADFVEEFNRLGVLDRIDRGRNVTLVASLTTATGRPLVVFSCQLQQLA